MTSQSDNKYYTKDTLKELKDYVEYSYDYFKDNYKNFVDSVRFTYVSQISPAQDNTLANLRKPPLQGNISLPFLEKIIGEFYKNVPGFTVYHEQNKQPPSELIEFYEGHINYAIVEAQKQAWQDSIIKDLLSGGMGVGEVIPEYENERSFVPLLRLKRCEPTMCGFDPMATLQTKSDGRYAFKVKIYSEKEFNTLFPEYKNKYNPYDIDISHFKWSYKNQTERIIKVIEFFLKEKQKVKLYLLSNYMTVTKEEYDALQKVVGIIKTAGYIPPMETFPEVIQGRSTMAEILTNFLKTGIFPSTLKIRDDFYKTAINKYVFFEKEIIKFEKLEYSSLPLVFADGNSITCPASGEQLNEVRQYINPYLKHTQGVQQIFNYLLQTIGHELEVAVAAKFMVPKPTMAELDTNGRSPYKNPQESIILPYLPYLNNDPNLPLPKPDIIQRPPIPGDLIQMLGICTQLMQHILGSQDTVLKNNSGIISGKALERSMINSESAAVPFFSGYMAFLNQIGTIYADMIPKIYTIPFNFPIKKEGKIEYRNIDLQNYDKDILNLKIRLQADFNFSTTKKEGFDRLTASAQAYSILNKYLNTPRNLSFILDNQDVIGIEKLKEGVDGFIQQLQSQPPSASDQFLERQIQVEEQENMIKAEKVRNDYDINQQKMENERLKLDLEVDKNVTDKAQISANLAIQTDDLDRKYHLKNMELANKMLTSKT